MIRKVRRKGLGGEYVELKDKIQLDRIILNNAISNYCKKVYFQV